MLFYFELKEDIKQLQNKKVDAPNKRQYESTSNAVSNIVSA